MDVKFVMQTFDTVSGPGNMNMELLTIDGGRFCMEINRIY